MPEYKVELDIWCASCGNGLEWTQGGVTIDGNNVRVPACARCIAKAHDDGYMRGTPDVYATGYADGHADGWAICSAEGKSDTGNRNRPCLYPLCPVCGSAVAGKLMAAKSITDHKGEIYYHPAGISVDCESADCNWGRMIWQIPGLGPSGVFHGDK